MSCTDQVYDCGILLRSIAYSKILENHLTVLHDNGWLLFPVNSNRTLPLYVAFTDFVNPKKQVIPRLVDRVNGGVDEVRDHGGVGGEVNNREDEGGKNEDEEFRRIENNALLSDNRDFSQAFLEWIRLQVDHFHAPRKITSFLKRTRSPPVNLTLLAVRHPKPMKAGEAIEPWRDTIQDICSRTDDKELEFKKIVGILEKKIAQGLKSQPKKSIFAKFGSKEADTYEYNATVHCETALAALDKFPSCVVCSEAVRDHIRVWFHFKYHHDICKSDAWRRISTAAQSLCQSSAAQSVGSSS